MKNMLEYQNLDIQLEKLKKDANNLDEKVIMNKMIAFVKDAQNKSLALENTAKLMIEDYNKLKVTYDKCYKEIDKITKQNVGELKSEQIEENLKIVNSISSELFMIERNINIIINKINEKLKEFEITKNNALKARAKHKENKIKYEEKLSQINPKIVEIENKLKEMEPLIDPKFFNKYKTLKNDGIKTVFVKLTDKCCGGCGMEIPSSKLDKIKNEDFLVCEQCRRIIYK